MSRLGRRLRTVGAPDDEQTVAALPTSVRWALRDIVGPDHVLVGDETAGHVVDWTGRFRGATPAVVRPGSVHEVAAVLDVCRRESLAVVPQGGNTGLVGGSVPLAGELVLSLRRLDAIGEVDTAAAQITVGAGATVESVQAAAAGAGLRYAVDFGARGSATIGGTIATNAGGINVLRYGATRHQLRGIEAVIGTGDVVRRLGGLVKDNTGYDLAGVLCGSEGTLGVVTAARLALVPAVTHRTTALVGFDSVDDAVAACAGWRTIPGLEALELMLADGVALVRREFDVPSPLADRASAYVLVEAAGDRDPTDDVAAAVAAAAGIVDAAVATDTGRREALWRLRDEHTPAINRVGIPHKFDVTLPIAGLADAVEEIRRVVLDAEPASATWIFGHVGDGNLHVNVTGVDPSARHLDDVVYRCVVGLGGSISAEHGIGTAKVPYLGLDRSDAELATMRAIKRALDPAGILNPAVLLPPSG